MIDPDNYCIEANYGSGLYNTGANKFGSGTTIIQADLSKDYENFNYSSGRHYFFAGSNHLGGAPTSFKLKIRLNNF